MHSEHVDQARNVLTRPELLQRLVLVTALVPAVPCAAVAASAERVIHAFQGTDGAAPYAGLTAVGSTLYGTTSAGGSYTCPDSEAGSGQGCGTVFRMSTAGKLKTLHVFTGSLNGGSDGASPYAALTAYEGDLFGTAVNGGVPACPDPGCGTVFKVTKSGKYTSLYAFQGVGETSADGANPYASLVNVSGTFYGTTYSGGSGYEAGGVFSITPSGQETLLYGFDDQFPDGKNPYGELLSSGAFLFGTLYFGGAGGCAPTCGAVYRITPGGGEQLVYSFAGGHGDGSNPTAGLIQSGNEFYGTATSGGSQYCGGSGCGTVYEVNTAGQEKTLYAFKGTDGADGNAPAAHLLAVNGNFYGTTAYGGNGTACPAVETTPAGCGTVYMITPKGVETVIYSFKGGDDGENPAGGLVLVGGKLYGTTINGGKFASGTVFEVTP